MMFYPEWIKLLFIPLCKPCVLAKINYSASARLPSCFPASVLYLIPLSGMLPIPTHVRGSSSTVPPESFPGFTQVEGPHPSHHRY